MQFIVNNFFVIRQYAYYVFNLHSKICRNIFLYRWKIYINIHCNLILTNDSRNLFLIFRKIGGGRTNKSSIITEASFSKVRVDKAFISEKFPKFQKLVVLETSGLVLSKQFLKMWEVFPEFWITRELRC